MKKDKVHTIKDAIQLIRKSAFAKFNESVELHITLNIDPKNSNHRIRFTTTLPHSTGKVIKILVISDKNTGKRKNVIWRDVSAVEDIVKGKLKPGVDFDVLVATPDAVKGLAKVAKILGPKGMMPSPKVGTATENPSEVVKDLSAGQIEVKNQPGHAVVHVVIGTLKSKDDEIVKNIEHLLAELRKNAPAKKKLIKKIYITSTMSPSLRIGATPPQKLTS